jgi:hypothetical protein
MGRLHVHIEGIYYPMWQMSLAVTCVLAKTAIYANRHGAAARDIKPH